MLGKLCALSFLVTAAIGNVCPPKYVILFPEVLQVGIEQTIAVSVFGEQALPVKVQIETIDGFVINGSNFIVVAKGTKEFKLRIPCMNVTEPIEGGTRYAYVKVITNPPNCPTNERRRVVLSFKSMSVFLQTDKPVYRRDDYVRILVAAVKPDHTPLDDHTEVIFDIKNPQALTIHRFVLKTASKFYKHSLNLGRDPLVGQWIIRAKYGCKNSVILDFPFQVEDFVLPRFEVLITPPKIISAVSDHIVVEVKSIYTYGKPVVGRLNVTLGVAERNSSLVQTFRTELFEMTSNDKGMKQLTFPNDGYGVFPEGKLLYIYAEVTERASYISQSNKDKSAVFTAVPILLDCSLSKSFYAPRLPYELKIQAKYANGESAAQKVIKITVGGNELLQATDESGIASFLLHINTPREIVFRGSVESQLEEKLCQVRAYQTSCSHYIVVTTRTPTPFKKGSLATFEIVKGENNANGEFDFHVVIISCGKVQNTFTARNAMGPISSFQVKIDSYFCETVCVAVYYETECNGKSAIISDFLCAEVEDSCFSDIRLQIHARDNVVRPGQDVPLEITARAYSSIALLAVDESLYLVNNKRGVTKEKFHYDMSCDYQINGVEGVFSSIGLTSLSSGIMSPVARDSEECSKSRRKRDVSPKEDLHVDSRSEDRTGREDSNCELLARTRELAAAGLNLFRDDVHVFLESFIPKEERKLRRGRSGNLQDPYSILINENSDFFDKRTYFPHVWLYDHEIMTERQDSYPLTISVPSTISDWNIRGFFLSEQGFCASDPIRLRAFKTLFVECRLPTFLRRLEQATVACTIYNHRQFSNSKVCLRLLVTREDVCTTAGSGESTDAICFSMDPLGTKTVLLPIVPLRKGKLKLQVRLITEFAGEDVETLIFVKPEGTAKEYSLSAELDPQEINSVSTKDWCTSLVGAEDFRKGYCYRGSSHLSYDQSKNCSGKIIAEKLSKRDCCGKLIDKFAVSWSDGNHCELCPKRLYERQCDAIGRKKQINTFYIRLPETYIFGSDRAWLSITGNYFLGSLGNTESWMQEPDGCGEQSIASLASQIAIVRRLPAEFRYTSIEAILKGYHSLLNCRSLMGVFAKDRRSPASTMLSAFALQTLCDARSDVAIDDAVTQSLVNFLANRQTQSGVFFESDSFSTDVTSDDRQAYVSAYVISGALECCHAPNHPLFAPNAVTAFCKGVQFLELSVERDLLRRRVTKAIVYGALVKACTTCRLCQCRADMLTKARHILNVVSAVRDDGSRFWPSDGASSYDIDTTSVETTAYALCAFVDDERIKEARPLAKWLNGEGTEVENFHHKPNRVSVAALRCLSKFASKMSFECDLTVSVTASGNNFLAKVFRVNDSNSDLIQTLELPRNDIVKVETTGSGLGIVQVHVKYNEVITRNDKCKFNLSVSSHYFFSSAIALSVCVQYLGDVNMDEVVVEVDLPSGYVACKEGQENCLKELKETWGKSNFLRSVEISGRGVIFYFDQIGSSLDQQRTCFTFRAIREYAVRSLTPVSAKVYYNNRKDQSCTIFYNLNNESPDLAVLCNEPEAGRETFCVCGAGRCPKLEPIMNRLCNACLHHDYVYRVEVLRIVTKGEWQKIIVKLVDILKHGNRYFNRGARITLWMRLICSRSLPFQIGKSYHVQGEDGIKFVLDHSFHVEKWPETLSACTKARAQCEQVKCEEKKNDKRRRCLDKCEDAHRDCKSGLRQFSKYVRKLKDEKAADCEMPLDKLCPQT
ncbi:complement C3-like isoform X2 [Oscarella lobularis]|uniref:complement C3-like isoform X2 n=1 Tax=Oscarella lobularis TaxID=121494 RepID=UPI00331432E6